MTAILDERGRNENLMRWATRAAVSVALILAVTKFVAWLATDSIALLSSLVDSALDGLASAINLIAVRQALQPADHDHRFGHGKAEPLAGLAQSAFVAGSGGFLIVEAVGRLWNPSAVQQGVWGVGAMAFSIVLTLVLVIFQKYVIGKTNSVAITADSLHYTGDIMINASVIVSLLLTEALGWRFVDPLFAVVISGYLLFNAYGIAKSSLDLLMDREFPEEDRTRIAEIARSFEHVYDIHDLRTRSSGHLRFIQLHLELERTLSLWKAHAVADRVERAIAAAFPNTEVIVHQDPAGLREEGHDNLIYQDRAHGIPGDDTLTGEGGTSLPLP